MEDDPFSTALQDTILNNAPSSQDPYSLIVGAFVLICLLITSALISGSEVAYFSLSPSDLKKLTEKNTARSKRVLKLLAKPEHLLATILVANNFVNVGIVILSAFLTNDLLSGMDGGWLILIQAVGITFVILLFGEIIPKVYATQYAKRFALVMSLNLLILEKIFRFISVPLVKSTSFVNRRVSSKTNISIDDLSQALDLTGDELKEDEKILKGIVNFGNIDVKEIMTSRMDVVGIEVEANFNKLMAVILYSGFSRIPVYVENFDTIKGVLYIKDLLPYLDENEDFKWQNLIRDPYFVPETKKIDDLLEEFQAKKIHMAVIIDEYGGSSGIITFEDIIEEIVGDINDESDDTDENYSRLSDNKYLFEGRTQLNDFYKITNVNEGTFNNVKGESDTIAGLILELKGEIPAKHEEIEFENFLFKIKSVDNRRIKQVYVTIRNK